MGPESAGQAGTLRWVDLCIASYYLARDLQVQFRIYFPSRQMSNVTRLSYKGVSRGSVYISNTPERSQHLPTTPHNTRNQTPTTGRPQTFPSAGPTPRLLLVQRRVPARLGPRHNQPADGGGAQQRDEDGLQDLDARARGDDAGDDGEEGAADLGEHEDEGEGRGAGVRVEELGGDVDALGLSAGHVSLEREP